jgi:hypothetical protein
MQREHDDAEKRGPFRQSILVLVEPGLEHYE